MNTRADIIDALRTLGNGDLERGKALLVALAARLNHAREKHPVFAESKTQALMAIDSEFKEFKVAVLCEPPERELDELLDVLATSVRFYNGEHDCK